ncbi:MAG: hypothetical protein ACRCYX_03620 [Dermatophilaceae bacterium]
MAMHGSNALANAADTNGWTFTAENLDGIWGNIAGMSEDEQANLFRKVATPNVVSEGAVTESPERSFFTPVADFKGVIERNPDLTPRNLEAVYFHTGEDWKWEKTSIAKAREEFGKPNCKVGAPYCFDKIGTGMQPHMREDTYPLNPAAKKAIDEGDGHFLECPRGACTNHPSLRKALKESHAANKPFVWFASSGTPQDPTNGWLAGVQETFNALCSEGLWKENDIITLINYEGRYPAVPETVNGQSADTTTGIAHWLLNQKC